MCDLRPVLKELLAAATAARGRNPIVNPGPATVLSPLHCTPDEPLCADMSLRTFLEKQHGQSCQQRDPQPFLWLVSSISGITIPFNTRIHSPPFTFTHTAIGSTSVSQMILINV